jgi:hypothetical protein
MGIRDGMFDMFGMCTKSRASDQPHYIMSVGVLCIYCRNV